MPAEIEAKIRASVKKAHPEYSKERVDQETYRVMNKQQLLRRKKAAANKSGTAHLKAIRRRKVTRKHGVKLGGPMLRPRRHA